MPKNELFFEKLPLASGCWKLCPQAPAMLPTPTAFLNLHNFDSNKMSILISKKFCFYSAPLFVIVPLHFSWLAKEPVEQDTTLRAGAKIILTPC